MNRIASSLEPGDVSPLRSDARFCVSTAWFCRPWCGPVRLRLHWGYAILPSEKIATFYLEVTVCHGSLADS